MSTQDPGRATESTGPAPTPVWLYPGKSSFGVVKGVLTLEGDRLKLQTSERVGKRAAEQVEKLAREPGLAERLTTDPGVTILERPRSTVAASFSKAAFGSVLYLRADNSKWRLALYSPQAVYGGPLALFTFPLLIASMAKGRRAAKPWRQALNATRVDGGS